MAHIQDLQGHLQANPRALLVPHLEQLGLHHVEPEVVEPGSNGVAAWTGGPSGSGCGGTTPGNGQCSGTSSMIG